MMPTGACRPRVSSPVRPLLTTPLFPPHQVHQLEAELKTLKKAVISKQTSSVSLRLPCSLTRRASCPPSLQPLQVGTVRARQLLYAQEVKLRNEAAAEAQAEGREAPYPPPKRPEGSSRHFLDQALDRE